MIAFLSTNKSRDKSVIVVDDDIFYKIRHYGWYADKNGYIIRRQRLTRTSFKNIRLHRLVMRVLDNTNALVDHINHNRSDNRRCNLRLCTVQENNRNSSKTKKVTYSAYKGVSLDKTKSAKHPWIAYITLNNKKYHLGCYSTEKEAALAYNKAATKHFGEFANLNIIN